MSPSSIGASLRRPVPAATLLAGLLHVLWWQFLATDGGDMAAQDAWAGFVRGHPGSAYDLAWYGGMHPASYSLLSPYVMALLGVRPTLVIAGTVSAALVALLLVRSRIARPMVPALYAAVALSLNAVSGRVTFGLGSMFALATIVVFTDGRPMTRGRLTAVAALATLATASSPVAGLFLGVAAAALLLERRLVLAVTIGLPPVLVVGVTAWLFPFAGQQPWGVTSALLPLTVSLAVAGLVPRAWRLVRLGSAVYALGVVVLLLFPNEVGSNVSRLALIYGGVVLVAALASSPALAIGRRAVVVGGRRIQAWGVPHLRHDHHRRHPQAAWLLRLTAVSVAVSSIWQVSLAAGDVAHTRVPEADRGDFVPLVAQLDARGAEAGRVEVVPLRSHREASALPDYVNLARGWNRQADLGRDPIFYDPELLTASSYHHWLRRMSVRYVALPSAETDPSSLGEAELVASEPAYLHLVWSNPDWRLYAVQQPTSIVDRPATLVDFNSDEIDVIVAHPGPVTVRIQYSPWLTLAQGTGLGEGCLAPVTVAATTTEPAVTWTRLRARHAGLYRITAPYHVPRGTPCPTDADSATGVHVRAR